jgi:hypothetical protein
VGLESLQNNIEPLLIISPVRVEGLLPSCSILGSEGAPPSRGSGWASLTFSGEKSEKLLVEF